MTYCRNKVCAVLLFVTIAPAAVLAAPDRATWYISPAGNDKHAGHTVTQSLRSFARAFDVMSSGDELVLMDGNYSESAGTGTITYTDPTANIGGPRSGQIPSGRGPEHPTLVRAQHPGNVRILGHLFVGRSFRKDQDIRIEGITFEGGGSLYNTRRVTVRHCGFHGSFGIGTNDHDQGNDLNLIEDVWIWTSGERIIAINYRANRNVWRRVLVRGDGCGTRDCRGRGNPNVGITVYESSDVSLQNVLVVDRILARGDAPYADFAVAHHTPGKYLFGRNEWLGTLSLRAPDNGYYMEPDHDGVIAPTLTLRNAVAWDPAGNGFTLTRAGHGNLLENLTVRAPHGDGIRIVPRLAAGGILRNVVSLDAGGAGIYSRYPPSHAVVAGSRGRDYGLESCRTGCYSLDPRRPVTKPVLSTPALKHIVRIEPGSWLSGRGEKGADIGANLVYRIGEDGRRHGESRYNSLTRQPLWPWPNEDRIQREMCVESSVTRGFCAAGSLTRYIWDYLGHP